MSNKTADRNQTTRKLTVSIATVIFLSLCLGITTFALVYSTVSVESNYFHSGIVDINLNDGKPVITENEFIFEPGMTVKKDFFIENRGTWAVYYKIYFGNVAGGLADVLEIKIQDGDTVLAEGTAAQLTRAGVNAAEEVLQAGERRELTVYFYFPKEAGNDAQNLTLSFDMYADAVQTKNNPNRFFD